MSDGIKVFERPDGTWSYEAHERGDIAFAGDGCATEEQAWEEAWEEADRCAAPGCSTCGDFGHIPNTPFNCPDCGSC